tara:strand:+ start:266 stop:907 length:642 start_codon:yes stop_codon:yes gene_type:complete
MTEPIDNIRSDYSLSYLVDLQRQHTKTISTGNFTITTNGGSYDGANYTGSSKSATYERFTINDGTNTRIVYLSMSLSTADAVSMSGGPDDNTVATRLATAINDTSTGTAINITATANTSVSPAIVTLAHDSGGTITVTKGQHLHDPYSAFSDMNEFTVSSAGSTVQDVAVPLRLSVAGPPSIRGQTTVGSTTDDVLNRGPFKTSIGKSESFVS